MATYARFEKNGEIHYGQADGNILNILSDSPLGSFKKTGESVKLEEMSYKNRGNFGVYINLERNRNSIQIGSSLDIASSKLRKVKVDGKYISPLGLTEYLGIISLTPLMDKIFIEGATNRRKFFDKMFSVSNRDYVKTLKKYSRVLKQRNAALFLVKETLMQHLQQL